MQKTMLLRDALVVLFAFAAIAPACSIAKPDPAAAIEDRSTRASGGLGAAQAIAALAYHLHIKEATYEADADYLVDRKGRMRIDVYIGGRRVFTECYDGHRAWEMDANGVAKPASSSGAAALWHGTQYPGQILALAELPAHGHKVSSVGEETIAGVSYAVLQLRMSDGFTTYRYIDPQTHLIARARDFRALHPDIDPKKVTLETTFSDYRSVDGVLRAFVSTQTDARDGKWLQTATVQSIKKPDALPDRLFVSGALPETLR